MKLSMQKQEIRPLFEIYTYHVLRIIRGLPV